MKKAVRSELEDFMTKMKDKARKVVAKRSADSEDEASSARDPENELKPVNVELPVWVMRELDKEADRLGISRKAVIRVWIVEKLDARRKGGDA